MTQRGRRGAASSEAAQKAHQRCVELAKVQRKADVREVMSTPTGRRFVWGELQRAGLFLSSFTGNAGTFFNEGARSQGLKLMGEVQEVCPDLYVAMVTEAMADQKAAALQKTQADALAEGDEDTDGN